jgi:hypothetical protein
MAGTNDIAQNTGPMSPEDSKNNFMAICEIARAHGIRVVLGPYRRHRSTGGDRICSPRRPSSR